MLGIAREFRLPCFFVAKELWISLKTSRYFPKMKFCLVCVSSTAQVVGGSARAQRHTQRRSSRAPTKKKQRQAQAIVHNIESDHGLQSVVAWRLSSSVIFIGFLAVLAKTSNWVHTITPFSNHILPFREALGISIILKYQYTTSRDWRDCHK